MEQGRGLLTWSVFITIVAIAMVQGALGPLLPLIAADMPMSHKVESFHITGLAAGGLLASLVVEPVRALIGRWRVIVGSVLIGVGAALLLNQAVNPMMTIAGAVLVGVSVSGVLIAGQTTLVARHPGRGAKFIGEVNVSFSVGAVAATALLPLIAVWWGWRAFPLSQILLLLLVAVPLLVASRPEARAVPERNLTDPDRPVTGARRPVFSYITLCAGTVVEWSLIFWLPTFLTSVGGLQDVVAARLAAVMFVAVMVFRLVGSGLMNRIGPAPVLIVSMTMTVLATGLLLVTTTVGMGTLVALLVGVSAANIYPAGMALVIEAHPTRADHAVARASMFVSISVIVFPLILGQLADVVGLRIAFFTVPVIAVLTVATARAIGAKKHPITLPDGVV